MNISFHDFITTHKNDSPVSLMLMYRDKQLSFSLQEAVLQIECRQKTARKLPSFIEKPEFLFPDRISAEQASDERVAAFHASLFPNVEKWLDMTAGLGIDAMTAALKTGCSVKAIELNPQKARALENNAKIMNIGHFEVINADSTRYIAETDDVFNIIFIDPARRDNSGNRTYSFSDCTPDITTLFHSLLDKSEHLLIKGSPLLDVTEMMRLFGNYLSDIYIVAVKGECKEILLIVSKKEDSVAIHAVDLDNDGLPDIHVTLSKEDIGNFGFQISELSEIKGEGYVYEPFSALQKLACSGWICSEFKGMAKMSVNSNLYYSENYYSEFPGRKFKVKSLLDKKSLKKLKGSRRSVISRNHPEGAEDIAKRNNFKSSENDYLIATRIGHKNQPVYIDVEKISLCGLK